MLLLLFVFTAIFLLLKDDNAAINKKIDNKSKYFKYFSFTNDTKVEDDSSSVDSKPNDVGSSLISSSSSSTSSLASSYPASSLPKSSLALPPKNPELLPYEPLNKESHLENATFYTLCQESDLDEMVRSVRSVEDKFNENYHYDWVFLNDNDFSDYFMNTIRTEASGKVYFGKIDKDVWGYPEFIDQEKAAKTREYMKKKKVIYGDMESYHHMCRFQSGYYFRHPLMMNYKYSWRVEPGIDILCYQNSDPFKIMHDNDLIYGFNISPRELPRTIHGLWKSVKKFLSTGENRRFIDPNNLEDFITTKILKSYNNCHFWTNFELVDMDWLRSEAYMSFFDYLDRAGGFYYERWGDAPIRSIALSLFVPKDKIRFFNEIGYYHDPLGHCPYNQAQLGLACECEASDGMYSEEVFDWHANSCLRNYFTAKKLPFEDQNPKQKSN